MQGILVHIWKPRLCSITGYINSICQELFERSVNITIDILFFISSPSKIRGEINIVTVLWSASAVGNCLQYSAIISITRNLCYYNRLHNWMKKFKNLCHESMRWSIFLYFFLSLVWILNSLIKNFGQFDKLFLFSYKKKCI